MRTTKNGGGRVIPPLIRQFINVAIVVANNCNTQLEK